MRHSRWFGAAEESGALQVLWQESGTLFCRVRRDDIQSDRNSSITMLVAAEQRSSNSINRLTHEYALKEHLESAWAIRPLELVQEHGRTILALEDPGGEPLSQLLGTTMGVESFLRLAIGITAAIRKMHQRGLVHKDIKPAHVLVNSSDGVIRLTGFGMASRLPRERQAPEPPEVIAGTLAYMAPEQTGRMNRSIDSRSDLYALGVTLYEALTGSLPFTAADPMEWVHCHIARQPMAPCERVRRVPPPLSAVIMKLLAKTAEERYQTAAGLERDLLHCLAEFEADGRIEDFVPGTQDIRDRLLIPEKLYGRARDIELLRAAFDRVVKGAAAELMLVSGYSGIGKSSVVNELHKILVPPRGLFASGKFDQYKRDIPYSTLAQAFQDLIRPLLGKSESELARWRDALREALGPNGQLMVDLVPELKFIIGDQAPVPELPPQDTQRRFQLVFRRFLAVFARPEHPLALFVDDLQWLDAATLNLLEDLLTQPDTKHLLLIGAYRDNEITSTHPLTRTLDAIRTAGVRVQEICLAPLTPDDAGQLIAESLHCDRESAASLARLVIEKTGGNPFFVTQFLSAMVEEGLLAFDHDMRSWVWDADRIHAKGYSDNVVDLMVGKLSRLPIDTQEALQQLACLGDSAEYALLAMIREKPKAELDRDLEEALRAGQLLASGGSYRFLHDRVREAAYSQIPEALRAETHLRIGRLLAERISGEKRDEAIFEIVNQLNRGAELVTSHNEREQLAELNLIAGKRAKESAAYVSALSYLDAGTALLSGDAWRQRPDLIFDLELHRAECEFVTGQIADAEVRLTMLSSRAANPVDRANVACLRSDLYTTQNQADQAVDICLDYMRQLGIEWSPHPTEEEARREYERTLSLLGHREIEELIDLPLMSRPEFVATMDVLLKALSPALFTDINLFSLILWWMVNLSLEHGNTDASCYAYVHTGAVAGPRFGNYKAGFRFGQLGYELVERRGLRRFEARTYLGFGVLIASWTKHFRMSRDLIRHTFDALNAIGDLTFAAYSWHNLIGNLLAGGDPLVDAQREAEQGLDFARKARFGLVIDNITAQLMLIRTLRGLTTTFGCFNGAQFDELQFERHLSSDPRLAFAECWYWTRKLQARFFAGDYAAAVDASSNAQRLLWTSPSFVEMAEAHFYGALSHAASCDIAFPIQYRQHVEALTAHHRQIVEWAANCPENFENRAALVGAEIARIEGRELDAERLYEKAIRSARENDFDHNQALANELAARFHAARGFETIANAYLREARSCYLRWGADGKVRQLETLYPSLREPEPARAVAVTIAAPLEHLDFATVVKVSQAVSGEMVPERLIDVLMRLAIEHAGAERGLLLLSRENEVRQEAEAITNGDTIIVRRNDLRAALPESIVQYATRTRKVVILDDASVHETFSTDAYVCERHARSVLCLPLVAESRLTGVLYLENNLTPYAFTPSRIAVLKLLALQAAISLDRKQAEDAARQSEKRYQEALLQLAHASRVATMGQLTASIAHEVNQPIAAAIMGAETAQRWLTRLPPDLERAEQAIGRILRDGRRAADILDRIRALVRLPSGGTTCKSMKRFRTSLAWLAAKSQRTAFICSSIWLIVCRWFKAIGSNFNRSCLT